MCATALLQPGSQVSGSRDHGLGRGASINIFLYWHAFQSEWPFIIIAIIWNLEGMVVEVGFFFCRMPLLPDARPHVKVAACSR